MNGLPAEVARALHQQLALLRKAADELETTLDRLGDSGLPEEAREADTDQLCFEVDDTWRTLQRFESTVLGFVHAEEEGLIAVVNVAATCWRRHGRRRGRRTRWG